MLPFCSTNTDVAVFGKIKLFFVFKVWQQLSGEILDTAWGFCSTKLTGSDVMSSKGAIFINLQLCRDLNVPAQQLVDWVWLTKKTLLSSAET